MRIDSGTPSSVQGPLPRGWIIVFCLFFVAGLNYLDRNLITTMRGSVVEAIPMNDTQFGLLTTVFLLVYGGFSPLAGFLADRFSRSKVILGSMFLWSAVTWLTSRATTYEELLFARAAMGLSEACYIPAALALIADYHRGTTRALAVGVHQSGISMGSSLGGLGGLLAEQHSWILPFQIFGVVGVIYSLFLAFIVRDPPKPVAERNQSVDGGVGFWDALRHLLNNPRFLMLLVCFSLMGLAGWAINAWMPTHIQEGFELKQGAAGMTTTGYLHTAGFIGSIVGGLLSDYWIRFDPRGRMAVPIIGLCIAGGGLMLTASAGLLWIAIAGLIAYGLCRHFADTNMMPILCIIADPRYRATGYGILNFCSCMVGAIGPYAGGHLRDAGMSVSIVFQVAAGGLLFAAFLFWVIHPIEKASAEAAPAQAN